MTRSRATARETDVLLSAVLDESAEAYSNRAAISPPTYRFHVGNVLRKCGALRFGALAASVRRGARGL